MTSNKTTAEIQQILDSYLTREQQINLLTELSRVQGNQSFKDSIRNLLVLVEAKQLSNERYQALGNSGSNGSE